MFNDLLKRVRNISSGLGTAAIGVMLDLLKQLYVRIKENDLEKVERILRVIEQAANLALDTVFMVRRILEDRKITAAEAEAVARMVANRTQEFTELKLLAEKAE